MSTKLTRIARLPGRIRRDLRLIAMLENWQDALIAECTQEPLRHARLRSGARLEGPETINLAFLFHETWVKRVYSPPGYEVRSGDLVIDIGANIGVFSIFAATRAPGVKVHAFEPFPENTRWLHKNIFSSGLSNITVHQQAVGASAGHRFLQVDQANWTMHSLFYRGSENQKLLSVDCIKFDEIPGRYGITKCDLLKLDCEGSEYEIILRCAPGTLKRVRRIVAEYHEGSDFGGTGVDLCKYLQAHRFRIDYFEATDFDCGLLCATNTDE